LGGVLEAIDASICHETVWGLYLQIAELSELRDEILSRVSTAVGQATKHKDSFDSYAHLWTDDRQDFLAQFLVYGHVPTQVYNRKQKKIESTINFGGNYIWQLGLKYW
jgi:hypothetical protein